MALLTFVMLGAVSLSAAIKATIDVDEDLDTPVPHRYLHGVIPDDAKFQLALPDQWNGKLVVFSRGFSGPELTPGAFKSTALEKGYAFAASDEGWNRLTIATEPEDSYYESRQRIRELTLYALRRRVRDRRATPAAIVVAQPQGFCRRATSACCLM